MSEKEREATTNLGFESAPIVIAKCVGCGDEREIKAGEIPRGSHPMCRHCFMPMVAKEARAS